jgi:hypothetical protein
MRDALAEGGGARRGAAVARQEMQGLRACRSFDVPTYVRSVIHV